MHSCCFHVPSLRLYGLYLCNFNVAFLYRGQIRDLCIKQTQWRNFTRILRPKNVNLARAVPAPEDWSCVNTYWTFCITCMCQSTLDAFLVRSGGATLLLDELCDKGRDQCKRCPWLDETHCCKFGRQVPQVGWEEWEDVSRVRDRLSSAKRR